MKPFLLLQSRPEDDTSDNEYDGILSTTGLETDQLERFRVESQPLPVIDLERYSGVIMGGGPFNASTPADKKSANQKRVEADLARLLTEMVQKDFPFFGICYGVSTLGSLLGGKVSGKYGESLRATVVSLTPEGIQDKLLLGMPESFEAISGHKEACEILPNEAVLLAASPTCPVHMFRVKHNLYVTQFHPELDMEGLRIRVNAYKHAGYFPPEDADKIIATLGKADLSHVSQMLKNFVAEYSSVSKNA
jgi:GMP synthase (glutamine-hydrolysing)